jgi:type II secretory pathway component GspD/PulD (secretin)
MRAQVILAATLALAAAAAWAQQRLQVIELQHRRAEELLPVLRPLVAPDGSISAMDYKLVVRASEAQIADLRRVAATLDVAARQLLISVRQVAADDSRRRSAGVSGSVPGTVRGEVSDQRSRGGGDAVQQVRVLEGSDAVIQVGQSLPYAARTPGGGAQVDYQDVLTGFRVRPRLQGSRVELEIRPQQDTPGPDGSINVRNMASTVSGPLGQWFEIGSAVQQASQRSRGLTRREESSQDSSSRVEVKVEAIP